MDERQRVSELAGIVRDRISKKAGTHIDYICPGGGDGHSFNDACEAVESDVYREFKVHLFRERRRARKELKRMRGKISDGEAREKADYCIRHSGAYYSIKEWVSDHPIATFCAVTTVAFMSFCGIINYLKEQ